MSRAGAYAWYVGTLRGGQITNRVSLVSTSWGVVMDDADSLAGTAVLTDAATRRRNLYVSAEPARCFLAVAYTDSHGTETFLAGGPIWSHSYDGAKRQLSIRAAGLWSLWDHRFVLPVLAAGASPATASSSYSGLSLGTIAKRLVQLAQTHVGSDVPVVLPDDETGTATRTYLGYEMSSLGTALKDLIGTQGGPEIQFVPRRNALDPTRLEWVMRVGTTEQPLLSQAGADWIWDLAAKRSPASGISVTRDGSAIAERAWVQGAGSETTTLFGRADDTSLIDAGFPLLETLDTNHSGENGANLPATLAGYANADLALSRRPTETWTFTVQRDGTPVVGTYQVGDWVRVKIAGDPYLPDGVYRSRITSLSGDDSAQVQVALAATTEAA